MRLVTLPLLFLLALAAPAAAQERARLLEGFESAAPWKITQSDGLATTLDSMAGATGRALRLRVDYKGRAGYAVAGRSLPIDFPDNFEISFKLKGSGPPNQLQVKFVDESGDNVWWWVRPAKPFPGEWETVRIKRRQISFAWGPTKDRTLKRTASVEFVLNAEAGGQGSFAVDELTIRPLPPENAPLPAPVVRATSGADPALALDNKRETLWRSGPAKAQALTVDFGRPREFGGLVLRWAEGAHASRYAVELSDDGRRWRSVRSVTGGDGGSDPLMLTEAEARFVRLQLEDGPGQNYGLAEIEVKELAFGADPNSFTKAIAREALRGTFPRSFSEQSYWTLVGVDGGANSALVSEDGAVELGKGGPSIEPFVVDGYRLTSWADVNVTQSLQDAYLPIPGVRWIHPDWTLDVRAFAPGDAQAAQLIARYTVTNRSRERRRLKLALALRPYQVNGPDQFLNIVGGHSPVRSLRWDGAQLRINETLAVTPLTTPLAVRLARFDENAVPLKLPLANAGEARTLEDPTGMASGALVYELDLAPGASRTVDLAVPLIGSPPVPLSVDRAQEQTAQTWRAKLNRFAIATPAAGQPIVDTMRSSLAHILMSREGPSLRPGTRSYARSWIRDGAMIAESLLRLGHDQIPADYLRWYAPYQFDNGKIPCCVDARGSDPTPENDSHGEFAFLAAEVFRYGRDRQLAEAIWPDVEQALRYQESQRQSERTAANLTPERRAFYGLMPPSISHEGYSDKAAYSYWDDFWALEGFQSGAALAGGLGKADAAAFWAGRERELRGDIVASVDAAVRRYAIDFVPGAADRGDFDATSTTIGLAPGDGAYSLPPVLVRNTFERQWRSIIDRRDGREVWEGYTPYELRNVGAFIRLGWRDRADEALRFYMADRRPPAWNGWAEGIRRAVREAGFIGDMPHAWIASDYLRSALDIFYYEREGDRALVLAAGVPADWLGEGFAVQGVRTPYGTLSYALRPARGGLTLSLSGDARPEGGFVLPWPLAGTPGEARIDGRKTGFTGTELRIPAGARRVVIGVPPTAKR